MAVRTDEEFAVGIKADDQFTPAANQAGRSSFSAIRLPLRRLGARTVGSGPTRRAPPV